MYFSAMYRLHWYCWAFLRYRSLQLQTKCCWQNGDFQPFYAKMSHKR